MLCTDINITFHIQSWGTRLMWPYGCNDDISYLFIRYQYINLKFGQPFYSHKPTFELDLPVEALDSHFFKIRCRVLANGADIVLGQFVTLVNVSADFANPAVFFAFLNFGLWLYVLVVV